MKKSLAYVLVAFWALVGLLELFFWADLKSFFFPRHPVVELVSGLCQDTIWLPSAVALPAYFLWLSCTALASWRTRLPAAFLSCLLLGWAIFDCTGFFRWMIFFAAVFFFAVFQWVYRQRRMRADLLLYLLVWLGIVLYYRGQLFPPIGHIHSTENGLRILDCNISVRDSGGLRAQLFALIERERPDIVFIQEINAGDRSLFREKVGKFYPYQIWSDRYEYYNGGAILSKYPFVQARNIDLSSNYFRGHTNLNYGVMNWHGNEVFLLNGHLFPSGHAFIELSFGRRTISSFIEHTRKSFLRRLDEAEQISGIVANIRGPIIMAGDFNDTRNSPLYCLFRRHLANAFEQGGWGIGGTFGCHSLKQSVSPRWHWLLFDFLRIDHIFISRHFRVEQARVLPVANSDHRPLFAHLTWRKVTDH